jgi:acyl-CoA dehydrogenase
MENVLLDSFCRLLGEISPAVAVRRAEQEGNVADILHAVDDSGFLDALVPESQGGSGLALSEVVPLILAAGEYLLPIPFAETMVARALIAGSEAHAPCGQTITLWPTTSAGHLRSQMPPLSAPSSLALVQRGTTFHLLPMICGESGHDPFRVRGIRAGFDFDFGSDADISAGAAPDQRAQPLLSFTRPDVDLLHWAAAITAATMAGALKRLLDLSLTHVNDRQQFGRTLSKFQAIQQQMSVFAERTVCAQVAARMGLSGFHLVLDGARVAIAKSIVNESATTCAGIAHAVHGAIGMSEAHDLRLYTRRLARGRLSFGSETYWQRILGNARLSAPDATSVDFVRRRLAGAPPG